MQANYVQRLRLRFSKEGPARYIGHLDLARTLERSLNRARIPVAYTQGFNRRPRLSLAVALPLGYTSECELADIWLTDRMEPEDARAQMMSKIAPGIDVQAVSEVPLNEPSLQSQTEASRYAVTLLDPIDEALLQGRIANLLAADSIPRRRQGKRGQVKRYDLRPLIFDLALREQAGKFAMIEMYLSLMPAKTGRPDEVLEVLELDPLAARVHRTALVLGEATAV